MDRDLKHMSTCLPLSCSYWCILWVVNVLDVDFVLRINVYGVNFGYFFYANTKTPSSRLVRCQVLNWGVLGPEYTTFDGLDAFEPTAALALPSATNLVACKEDPVLEQAHEDFHYFLSGTTMCVRAFFLFLFLRLVGLLLKPGMDAPRLVDKTAKRML